MESQGAVQFPGRAELGPIIPESAHFLPRYSIELIRFRTNASFIRAVVCVCLLGRSQSVSRAESKWLWNASSSWVDKEAGQLILAPRHFLPRLVQIRFRTYNTSEPPDQHLLHFVRSIQVDKSHPPFFSRAFPFITFRTVNTGRLLANIHPRISPAQVTLLSSKGFSSRFVQCIQVDKSHPPFFSKGFPLISYS